MTEGVPEQARQPLAEPAADGGRRTSGPATAGGGRRSAEATRAAILRAARDRFAADGYDRATIRAIAADARIDPSMVMRYYGSKENLFATAAEFDLRLPDFSGVPVDRLGTELVGYFFTRWEGDATLPALLRTASTNPGAAERVRAIFTTQLSVAVGRVVADPAEAPRRAGLVASQLLGVALTRYVLRLPPMVDISPADLITWLSPTIHRYLTDPDPTPRRPPLR
ncbi:MULTISPECIES: TetR family transcriptional regulator [unclassified Micromonospora]|uniref:TetR/AcrR family transcriptional regulator n=1 Tax=unclassified Micromonospora TaxID=2617518 RepID=UPI0022B6AD6E|nr:MULTISPECIES: TetR family transcriptional regulator [unclassified Micromonospora]MCZ7421720.1 TetR family transcriptional regulator [Verrucosispora sp. WMMA2121]WBB93606.1 TetR family transcriptional regulator [Verrucosispora sp. WMMC514]